MSIFIENFYLTRNPKPSSSFQENYKCEMLRFVLYNSDKYSDSAISTFLYFFNMFIERLLCIGILIGAWDMVLNQTKLLALEKLTFI